MAHRIRTVRFAVATAVTMGLALVAPLLSPASGTTPSTVNGGSAERAAECDPFRDPDVDLSVPTSDEVIGIELGDRDVTTAESDRYLQAVSAASPKVVDGVLGRSSNGRPLRYAVVGKKRWVQPDALSRIGRKLNELRDADTSAAQARRIVRRTPAVLWVAGNVHGGEESGADASLRVLYELAAREDCAASEILDRAVVVILPIQNPDGREADTRRNAYDFDLNRDWFARTQRETDAKVAKLGELPPQLFIDAHEMGRADYFFPPNADPVYHDIGETPLNWIYNVYGTAMQEAFNRFSIPYFNGDIYDLFYMGYGDSVPTTGFNAAGMTFEKNNSDPAEQRVREQYVAIWATLSAAGRRHSILKEWRAEHVKAARQGRRGMLERNKLYWEGTEIENQVPDVRVRHYFFRATPGKEAATQRLVARLKGMDVDVFQLTSRLQVPDYTPYGRSARAAKLPKGTYWVPMSQGQKHWVQAMLNEDTYVPFPYFYDVTAFSGPLLNNVPGGYSGARLNPAAKPAKVGGALEGRRFGGAPRVGIWQISQSSSSSLESAGWLRWYLDRRLQLVYQELAAGDFSTGGLEGLDVLVIPNGDGGTAATALGPTGQQALVDWVDQGGTLVTLRDSSTLAESLGLTTATSTAPTSDIPGSLIRLEVDSGNPLSRDVGRTVYAMYEYDLVWTTPSRASMAAQYPGVGDDDWFISGFAQGADELHDTAAIVDEGYGDGRVVLFGFDPNYRAFTEGTQQILRNAVLGPTPTDLPPVLKASGRATGDVTQPVSDRMVITVEAGAAPDVRAMLESYGAKANVVSDDGQTSFRVDLKGRVADDHPWAQLLAEDVAELENAVVAIRLP